MFFNNNQAKKEKGFLEKTKDAATGLKDKIFKKKEDPPVDQDP